MHLKKKNGGGKRGSSSPPGARTLAVRILAAAAAQKVAVEDLLAETLRSHPALPRVERALVLELVQGVKRWEIRLDYILSQISRRPLQKLHPLVLIILRLAAYQLLFLDRVPAHAAVSEAGRVARTWHLPQALVGFINGVLRRLAAGEMPPLPPLESDSVWALSVESAHPPWLVALWLERYGLSLTRSKLAANNQIPPLTIRVNTLKTDPAALRERLWQEGVEAVPCRFSPVGLHLLRFEAPPLSLPSFRDGLWLFQDEGAQLVSALLPLLPGQRVAELGAGRGGKTTYLAERLGRDGQVLALDRHHGRLRDLAALAQRWGTAVIQPLRADATISLPLHPCSLDAVMIDAPCSALGIIRRHPEIKTRLKKEELATFPPRQLAMLHQAASLVRRGGHLLYITCTTEPEENQEVVATFLAGHPEFHLSSRPDLLPLTAAPCFKPSGFFISSPEELNLDGFFGALLVRK